MIFPYLPTDLKGYVIFNEATNLYGAREYRFNHKMPCIYEKLSTAKSTGVRQMFEHNKKLYISKSVETLALADTVFIYDISNGSKLFSLKNLYEDRLKSMLRHHKLTVADIVYR